MAKASSAPEKLRKAREAEARAGGDPKAAAEVDRIKEEQQAEFHTPATAVLQSMQPFSIEGGEGQVHRMVARQAKVAAKQALKEAGRHLLAAAAIKPLIRRHPWFVLGGAAAVGFAAAAMLVPSEKQRAASRLRALERAIQAEAAGLEPAARSRFGSSRVLRLAWRFARPTLLSMVAGALSGATTSAAVDSDGVATHGATRPPSPPPPDHPAADDVT